MIVTTVGESIPQMLAGGVAGKGLHAMKGVGAFSKYGYAVVNNKRVVVDAKTRGVVKIDD